MMSFSVQSYVKAAMILVVVGCSSTQTVGQGVTLPPVEVPYYWDVNESVRNNKVYEVQHELMNLKYHDPYGTSAELALTIYNWKREVVASLSLDKQVGLNYFNVRLKEVYAGWEFEKPYTCELKDDVNKKYEWKIRLIEAPEVNAPEVDLLVNPLKMKCSDLAENKVEFYGEIKGGKAPYAVSWYVMNNNRTDFLYKPSEATLNAAGKTTMIEVNSIPDYFVLLYVKDACGNHRQKMVHLVCEQKKKRISTLFVEPTQHLQPVPKPTN